MLVVSESGLADIARQSNFGDQIGDSIYGGGLGSIAGVKDYLSNQYVARCPFVKRTVDRVAEMISYHRIFEENYFSSSGEVDDHNLAEVCLAGFMSINQGHWTRRMSSWFGSQYMFWAYHHDGKTDCFFPEELGEIVFNHVKSGFQETNSLLYCNRLIPPNKETMIIAYMVAGLN